MIDDRPEMQGQNPSSGKLVLPGYSEAPHSPNTYTQGMYTSPRHFASRNISSAPRAPLAKLKYLWQSDPAYKVLIVSVAMVLAASLVLVTLASIVLAQKPSGNTTALTGTNPQGPTNTRPTFPTPSGGHGSTSSSQPPQNPTPVLQNTPQATLPPQPTLQPTQPTQEIHQRYKLRPFHSRCATVQLYSSVSQQTWKA